VCVCVCVYRMELEALARASGLPTYLVADAGRTQVCTAPMPPCGPGLRSSTPLSYVLICKYFCAYEPYDSLGGCVMPHAPIHTQVDPGTVTVLAVGPAVAEDVDQVTGKLPLL
jgi:hypothetical protein